MSAMLLAVLGLCRPSLAFDRQQFVVASGPSSDILAGFPTDM